MKRIFVRSILQWASIILCLFSFVLLNGCSTMTSQKDGPPPFDVDVSKIPDAVPKREAMSQYGNIPSYKVFGKYYHTMKSAKNYHAQGVASWYGTKFHKQRTSSGEPYDMLGMTAAHKTLPLPTYVQVTNLNNGKKVIVKVNDRGPFEGNRLIDLSYVAAKKLGMLGHGTTHVDVRAIDPDSYSPEKPSISSLFAANSTPLYSPVEKTTPYFSNSKTVFLQVGAFKNRVYAEKLKQRLVAMINSPVQITKMAHTHHQLYHVKIGPIKDVATAKHITQRLRSIGLSSKRALA